MKLKKIVPLIFIFGLVFSLINFAGSESLDRTFNTLKATITLDEKTIIETDHSASIRIVPIIVLAKKITILTKEGWFGHGMDSVSSFLYMHLPGAGNKVTGGGTLAFAYEYGFLSFLLLILFTLKSVFDKENPMISIIFWIMLIILNSVNSQILWLAVLLLYSNNFFKKLSFLNSKNI